MMFNGEVEKVMRKQRKDDFEVEVEKGEEFGFDSKEDEVVPRVEYVSLVDGVFDRAFGGDGDEDFTIGDGV
ncbi:hypothetical protein Tco_0573501 [Tanacetum coccineum]